MNKPEAKTQDPIKKISYIGVGANLNNPHSQVQNAISLLAELPDTQLVQSSSLYQSSPMGPENQPDYVNAVVKLETQLAAFSLLRELQKIENAQGRIRNSERWGPRILDLDILLYNDEIISEPELTIPHYGMRQRNFVLIPLFEIEPTLMLPQEQPLAALLDTVNTSGIRKL